jgi:hypothetical protein
MTYRQFVITLPEDITQTDSAKKYDEYICQHSEKARADFFHTHHQEDWLKAQFHPSSVEVCVCSPHHTSFENSHHGPTETGGLSQGSVSSFQL